MPVSGTFLYAASAELKTILQDKYAVLTLDDPVFTDIMPITSVNAAKVMWDQRDNFKGLMTPRRVGGEYGVVTREGVSRFEVRPGWYGDKKNIDEQMLAEAAQIGTFASPVDIGGLQSNDQDHLLTRAIQRLKWIGWNFCTTGKYTCSDANGNIVVADEASLIPFVTSVAWSDHANATPLYDLRQLKLRHRGHSVSFGRDARIYLNSTDVNDLLANTNQNDLGAKRFIQLAGGGATTQPLTLADVNTYLASADLPQIVEWDDNYIGDDGSVNTYIAAGYGVCIGKRLRGEPVSEFMMTLNPELMMNGVAGNHVAGPGQELGQFDNLYYNFRWEHEPLRGISAMAFNGAPAIYYPSAVVPFQPGGGGSDA